MAINISTIQLNATIEKVWDALTNPVLVKQWQFGSDLITDWKEGSEIKFITEWEGQIFKQWGHVLNVKINECIVYDLFAPRPDLEDKLENYFVMKYFLTTENDKINLQIIQEDNRPNARQEDPQGEENPMLQMLKNLVETK
jgi:uncharacterized protein YndB with AHSA1/START domain